MNTVTDLPDEVIEEILSFLPPKDVIHTMSTTPRLRYIGMNALFWKNHCKAEWEALSQVEPLDEVEGTLYDQDWYHIYMSRQEDYYKYQNRFAVRRWLITDYFKPLWWLFVNPNGDLPLYMPLEFTENYKRRALRSGVILTDIFLFVPLIIVSLVFGWYSLIFIPYLFFMTALSLIYLDVDFEKLSGLGLIAATLLLGIGSLLICYFNDLVTVTIFTLCASIALAMSHSLRSLIYEQDYDHWFDFKNLSLISLIVVSVLTGCLISIAGLRIFAVLLAVLVILALFVGGSGDGGGAEIIFAYVGVKGVLMVLTLILSLCLYGLGRYAFGRSDKKPFYQKILSLLLMLTQFLLFLLLVTRFIMIVGFNFEIINIPDFDGMWWNRNSTITNQDSLMF